MENQDKSTGIDKIIAQIESASLNLKDVLNDPRLKRRLAELSAWEEYSKKTVPLIWDEIQENIARQNREKYNPGERKKVLN